MALRYLASFPSQRCTCRLACLDQRSIIKCSSSFSTDRDFFGIEHVTNKDIAGAITSMNLDATSINERYKPLLEKRFSKKVEEKEILTTYGHLRRDEDNIPREHGQFDERIRPNYSTAQIKRIFMNINNVQQSDETSQATDEKPLHESQQYGQQVRLVEVTADSDLNTAIGTIASTSESNMLDSTAGNRQTLSFEFKYQRPNTYQTSHLDHKNNYHETTSSRDFTRIESGTIEDVDRLERELLIEKEGMREDNVEELVFDVDKDKRAHMKIEKDEGLDDSDPYDRNEERINVEFDRHLENSIDVKNEENKKRNAFEYLKSIKKDLSKAKTPELKSALAAGLDESITRVKVDSRGYIDYSSQVPKFDTYRKCEILDLIKSRVLYRNYDLVVINKPYGISCHGSHGGESTSLISYLDNLASHLRTEKLFLTHRIDKSTTGLLVLASSQKKADFLNKQFAAGDIRKTYWCITKEVPQPTQGIIDIPIEEFTIDGKSRQGLRPELIENLRHLTKRRDNSKRAITEYNVLSSFGSAALVEVRPKTGVKHQIRCHLGFGLRAPILGDHKYSHITKVLPQRLPADLLLRLNVRQAKARTIPMHLHARSLVIPQAKPSGEDVFLTAPLPRFFYNNLKTLKLLTTDLRGRIR